jgi:hypothetical protein
MKRTQLNFSEALDVLKVGGKLVRNGWNGKNMFIQAQFPDEHSKMTIEYLYIKGSKGQQAPWLPSQEDIFADDWEVL